jgi:predicted ATPase
VSEALARVEAGTGHMVQAELYRLQGALVLDKGEAGSLQDAEASFLKAMDIARTQQALAWELRACMDLSRLWQRSGRGWAARERLSTVYSQFSEGFDTPDLREARGLLEELSS